MTVGLAVFCFSNSGIRAATAVTCQILNDERGGVRIDSPAKWCQFFGMAKQVRDKQGSDGFSRREREIMEALYKLGKASAAQILDEIPNAPTYTAIRSHLAILERKGHVRHASDGTRYI